MRTILATAVARIVAGMRHVLRALAWVEIAFTATLVLLMIAAITAEVYYRYVLSDSLYWVEEGATMCFIWITMIGAAVAAKARRHIVIVTFRGRSGPRLDWFLEFAGHLLVTLMAGLLCHFAYGYTALQGKTLTVSLPVNVPRSWMFSWPLALGMASACATYFYYMLDNVAHVLSKNEHRQAAPVLEI